VVRRRLPAEEDAPVLVLYTHLRPARRPRGRDGVAALGRLAGLLRPQGAVDAPEVLVERLAHVPVDAAHDRLLAPRLPLLRQIGAGKARAGRADEVALAPLEDLLREIERSDLPRGDDRRLEPRGAHGRAHRLGDVEVRAVGVVRARHAAIAGVAGVRVER